METTWLVLEGLCQVSLTPASASPPDNAGIPERKDNVLACAGKAESGQPQPAPVGRRDVVRRLKRVDITLA